MGRLIPKTVTLESSLKFFGLDQGRSDGSMIQVTYDIDDLDGSEYRRALLQEKFRLDLQVLYMEMLRGAVSQEKFIQERDHLKAGYGKVLAKGKNVPSGPDETS